MAEDAASAAAADVVSDIIGDGNVAVAETEVSEQTAPVEEAVDFDIPNLEADTEGIEDLLDEPDDLYDDEPDDEPVGRTEEPSEYDDPEVAKLKSKLAKAEKQIQYQAQLRAKAEEKQWRAEAARRFPLADVDEINATSRRGFLKKAKEQHDRYDNKLKPITAALEQLKTAAVAEVKTQARAEAEQAWGRPTGGPVVPQIQQAEDAAKTERGRFRTLHDLTLARIRAGTLEI